MELAKQVGWFFGLSGLVMLLFGLWIFATPIYSVESLIFIVGLLLFITGMLKLFEALFVVRKAKFAGPLAVGGLVSFCVGLLLLASPSSVAMGVVFAFSALALLLALLAFVSGLGHIFHGLRLKKGKWMPVAFGAVLVLLAAFMLWHPLAAGVGLIMAVGVFFMIYGALLMGIAFNLKKLCAS
jgi:uncharacterized membrane protein HdeD (DUF308 family)